MKKLLFGLVLLGLVAVSPSLAQALTTDLIYTPSEAGLTNIAGVTGDAAPGFEVGSFVPANNTVKSEIYFSPLTLFGRDVTLGEIKSISYWTKTGVLHAVDFRDWYLAIYTKPYTGDVSTPTWYGDRIGAEPYFSLNLADTTGWNLWSTDGASNQLRFFESTQGAPGANFGTYTDPSWSVLMTNNALSNQAYATRELLYFSIQTGSAWANGFTGNLDGLTIELTDGSVSTVNFELEMPVVTPTTKDECKNSGWMSFVAPQFKNQGDCVSFVQSNPKALGNKNK